LDEIYGDMAAIYAMQWVEKQCSERHRWVQEAFTVRWRDAIEALGLCLSQPRFRARIQQALMYCAECSLWAQRNQEARPAFLEWGFSRVLKESRFWGELQNDMVAAHGMDWEELYISYPCFVDGKTDLDGRAVIAVYSAPRLFQVAMRFRARLTEYAGGCASGKTAIFQICGRDGLEASSYIVLEKCGEHAWRIAFHGGPHGACPNPEDICTVAKWVACWYSTLQGPIDDEDKPTS
jgi:hypothetical protein